MSKVIWLNLPSLELQDVNKMFQILGYKSYNVFEIYGKDDHLKAWRSIFLSQTDFDPALIDNYEVAFPPASYYYLQILKAYPDAKFILEDIDGTTFHQRYKRLQNIISIFSVIRFFPKTKAFYHFIKLYMIAGYYNKKTSLDFQILHKELIYNYQKHIPKNQLLIFSPKEGWEPICKFLNKEIPKEEIPLKGQLTTLSSNRMGILFSRITNNLAFVILYLAVLASLFIYLIFFY